jgi:hypothetical protein
MGKYLDLENDIFSIIDDVKPLLTSTKIYPANFVSVNPGTKFLRVSVIPSGSGINLKSISGLVIVDIYTPVGEGPRTTSLIADAMDQYLVGKSVNTSGRGVTQFGNSSLQPGSIDKDSPTLFRSTYTIPFNFFGV